MTKLSVSAVLFLGIIAVSHAATLNKSPILKVAAPQEPKPIDITAVDLVGVIDPLSKIQNSMKAHRADKRFREESDDLKQVRRLLEQDDIAEFVTDVIVDKLIARAKNIPLEDWKQFFNSFVDKPEQSQPELTLKSFSVLQFNFGDANEDDLTQLGDFDDVAPSDDQESNVISLFGDELNSVDESPADLDAWNKVFGASGSNIAKKDQSSNSDWFDDYDDNMFSSEEQLFRNKK